MASARSILLNALSALALLAGAGAAAAADAGDAGQAGGFRIAVGQAVGVDSPALASGSAAPSLGAGTYLSGDDGVLVSGMRGGIKTYLSPTVDGFRVAVELGDVGFGVSELASRRMSDATMLFATSVGPLGFELGAGATNLSPGTRADGPLLDRDGRGASALHLGGRVGLYGVTLGISAVRGVASVGGVPAGGSNFDLRGVATSLGFGTDAWSIGGSYELLSRPNEFGAGVNGRSSNTKLGAALSLAPGFTLFGDWSRFNAAQPDGAATGRREGAVYLLGTAVKF